MVSVCQRQRKVAVGDGFDLVAEDLDSEDGWLSSTIWMKMIVAVMPAVKFGQQKWIHYALWRSLVGLVSIGAVDE